MQKAEYSRAAAGSFIPGSAFSTESESQQKHTSAAKPIADGLSMSINGPHGREPAKTEDYLLPEYWNTRFQEEEEYDWFKGYSTFKHLLLPQLKKNDRVLVLGCGNSSLTADMWNDGFKDITSIDLSEVISTTTVNSEYAPIKAINHMKSMRHSLG